MWAHLNIQTRPPVAIMLAHLQNITGGAPPAGMCACSRPLVSNRPPPGVRAGRAFAADALERWAFSDSAPKVFMKIYDFLKERWSTLTPAQRQTLRSLRIVRYCAASWLRRPPVRLRSCVWLRTGLGAGLDCPRGANTGARGEPLGPGRPDLFPAQREPRAVRL
jgi:hypothetical protein